MAPDDPRHGTTAGRHAHRTAGQPTCDPCRNAAARYEQEVQLDRLAGRPRTVPAQGTRRRLQALVALGHSWHTIGAALGMDPASAGAICRRRSDTVRAVTDAKVAALYEAWSMRLPDETTPRGRRQAAYARTVARRNHWLPPLAWDDIDHDTEPAAPEPVHDVDEAAVERVIGGEWRLRTTPAEKAAVVTRWRASGRSLHELAAITGWNVDRYHRTQHDHHERTAA